MRGQLTELGEQFRDVLPNIGPLFLNLGTTEPAALERDGGPFGQVMRLLRNPNAPLDAFRTLITEVVEHLESTMPRAERMRWLELMNYMDGFVYHYRDGSEHNAL